MFNSRKSVPISHQATPDVSRIKSKRGEPEGTTLIETGRPEAQLGPATLAFGLAFCAFRLQQVERRDEALVEGFAAHAQRLQRGVMSPAGGLVEGNGLFQIPVGATLLDGHGPFPVDAG